MINIKSEEYKKYIVNKIDEFNSNNKPTILLINDCFFPIIDGVVNVLDNHAKRLINDFNVIVCTPATKNIVDINKEYAVLACKSIFVKSVGYPLAKPKNDKFFNSCLNKIKNIKLIHSHSPFFLGRYFLKYANKHNFKFISTFHSLYKKDILNKFHFNWLANILLKNVMYVFNHSFYVYTMHDKLKDMIREYKCKTDVKILPNATDFLPLENKSEWINKINNDYHLEDKQNILFFIGRIIKVKNVFFLLNVYKELKQLNFPFYAIFVGEGPDMKKLQKRIKKYHLENNVLLTKKISDKNYIKAFFNRSDLFVFPSTYDASSIVQLEAASQSKSGLYIKDSVTSFTVKDNFDGYLSELDPKIYANKIIDIFKNKNKLNETNLNAYKFLYKTWDEIVDQLKYDYKNLINNK